MVTIHKGQQQLVQLLKERTCLVFFTDHTNFNSYFFLNFLTWFNGCRITIAERIAGVSFGAGAHRHVVVNRAQGRNTTGSLTRISALLIGTCKIHGAIWIHATFRSTGRWGSDISWQTGTRGCTTDVPAFCVHATRWWHARIFGSEVSVFLGWF